VTVCSMARHRRHRPLDVRATDTNFHLPISMGRLFLADPTRSSPSRPNGFFMPGRVGCRAGLAAQARPYVQFIGPVRANTENSLMGCDRPDSINLAVEVTLEAAWRRSSTAEVGFPQTAAEAALATGHRDRSSGPHRGRRRRMLERGGQEGWADERRRRRLKGGATGGDLEEAPRGTGGGASKREGMPRWIERGPRRA
jgi:hypothetical protein